MGRLGAVSLLHSSSVCLLTEILKWNFFPFQWKKHWFVLADQSLRYYRDSVAEEVSILALLPLGR